MAWGGGMECGGMGWKGKGGEVMRGGDEGRG